MVTMNIYEYLFSFFSFLALVLAILLFLKKKGDRWANILLGIYVLLFGYNVFYNTLYWSKKLFTTDFIGILFTNILVWVLYGPILYFYIRRVLYGSKFKWKDLIHFLPFLIVLVNYSRIYLMSPEAKMELLENRRIALHIYFLTSYEKIAIIALMLLYFALIYLRFKKGTVGVNQKVWLKWVSFSYLAYVFSFSSYFVLKGLGILQQEHDYAIGASMIFFISMLAYFGFVQPEVFEGTPVLKYKTTGLTKEYSLELKENMQKFMEEAKPYLKSEFRLNDLAENLNVSRHHCSQVINEHFNSTFFSFVNRYRIEEAKKMLEKDQSLTISDVMYACGFNNRMSFYNAFKKFTGTTPKTFLKSNSK